MTDHSVYPKKVAPQYYFSHGSWHNDFDIPRGTFSDVSSVNKFGRCTNADQNIATDIWDAANPTEDDDVWVAPTVARVHAITSNDAGDTAGGAGARTVRVYGLQSWDSVESSEVVTLNGLGAVNTVYSYVIIHRIKVETTGATAVNIGDIFATAAVDGTITAMVIALEGQTQMAVYGIASSQALYVTSFYCNVERDSPTGADVLCRLLWTPDVKGQVGIFQVKHTLSVAVGSDVQHFYEPHNRFRGPGILKLQVTSDSNDTFANGGFDLILEDLP